MIRYKDIFVGKSSALAEAIEKGSAEAKKTYDETSARYAAMHSKEDRAWFAAKSKRAAPTADGLIYERASKATAPADLVALGEASLAVLEAELKKEKV